MAKLSFERRKFIVSPRFQLVLAAKSVAFLFIYGVLIVYTSLHTMAETIYVLPFNCLTPEVRARLWALPVEALLLTVLITLVGLLHIILLSHRIAGPEFRFKRILREMAAGQYPQRVTLRKHDFLKGLAENLTLLSQALRERRQAHADQLAQLRGRVEDCATLIQRGTRPEMVLVHLEGLAKQISNLQEGHAREMASGGADHATPAPASQPMDSAAVHVPCDHA